MSTPAHVRELTAEDGLSLARLLTHLAEETEHVLLSVDEARAAEGAQAGRTRQLLAAGNQCLFVADADGALVGFIGLTQGLFEKNRHAASLMIGVLRSHWGQGVADSLMEAALGWSADRGILRIELGVMTGNARALAFYARYGFEREGLKRHAVRLADGWADELLLARVDGGIDGAVDGNVDGG